VGFPTPSKKLEFFSKTLKDWKWPEHAVPGYIRSHVHWSSIDPARGEMVLLPTFRLPTLIHTRPGNANWLYEIPHTNPLLLHPQHAARFGVTTWELETDRGSRTAHVKERSDIRPMPDGRIMLTDVDGVKYEIPPMEELDERSRTCLQIEA